MQRLLFWWFDRHLKKLVSFVLLFCLSVIAVSCTEPSSNTSSQVSTTSPSQSVVTKPLNVAVIPWRSPEEQDKKLRLLADYLQKTTKRPVNFQTSKNYETAVDLLVQEKVEIAFLGSLTYIQANERNANLEPLVVPIDSTTSRPWYTSMIVADVSKNIQTLQDLKGKQFGFVSPSSTSGFLVPLNKFQSLGIDPSRDFTGIRYLGSHDKAIAALTLGEVDAIAIESPAFEQNKTKGKLSANDYKVIWESDPIPTGPMVINKSKFTPSEITQLRQALIDAPIGVAGIGVSNSSGYTLSKDADFETMRQIYARLKSIKIAEK